MKIPTETGCYKVYIENEYGNDAETKLVILKRDRNGYLYQYCANTSMTTLTIGFGGYKEYWEKLGSIDWHIEVQKSRNPKKKEN